MPRPTSRCSARPTAATTTPAWQPLAATTCRRYTSSAPTANRRFTASATPETAQAPPGRLHTVHGFVGRASSEWNTFQTDILHVPVKSVEVCPTFVNYSNGSQPSPCSIWHQGQSLAGRYQWRASSLPHLSPDSHCPIPATHELLPPRAPDGVMADGRCWGHRVERRLPRCWWTSDRQVMRT